MARGPRILDFDALPRALKELCWATNDLQRAVDFHSAGIYTFEEAERAIAAEGEQKRREILAAQERERLKSPVGGPLKRKRRQR